MGFNWGFKGLIRKIEGKRTLGGFRYRCKDVTNMNIREMGCEYVSWFLLALDGFQKQACANGDLPLVLRKAGPHKG